MSTTDKIKIYRVTCTHAFMARELGMYRVTDTWAQDYATGRQGLTSVEYREADDDSIEWIESL
jgi:hypothetical protein